MKRVKYTDNIGRNFLVLIPDNAPDQAAQYGMVIGPPELDIDLPEATLVRLHNELYARGLYSLKEVRRNRQEIMSALHAALSVDVERVVQSYHHWEEAQQHG